MLAITFCKFCQDLKLIRLAIQEDASPIRDLNSNLANRLPSDENKAHKAKDQHTLIYIYFL